MLRPLKGAPSEMSDEALIAACGQGDTAALGALFDRHADSVYRFLARMSGTDRQDLDDLMQSTFIEIQKSANRYRGHAAVRTWIFGIAANVVRHHIRNEKRRKGLLDAVKTLPPPPNDAPDDVALRNQQLKRLALGVGALSYKLRVVFVMCDLEGVSGVEAARILGVRQGTIWRRLHDARKSLSNAIERRDK